MVVTINKFSILKLERFTCFFIDYQLGTKDIFYVEGCQYWEYGGFLGDSAIPTHLQSLHHSASILMTISLN